MSDVVGWTRSLRVRKVVAGVIAFLLASVILSAFIDSTEHAALALVGYVIGGGLLFAAIYGWLVHTRH